MSDISHKKENNKLKIRLFAFFAILLFTVNIKGQAVIVADFSKKIGTGSDLMFGGNNYGFSNKSVCDDHKKAGFNVARYDAFMNDIVTLTTLSKYKNNKDNSRDPKTWHWEKIDRDLNMLNSSGFKVMLIIDYSPLWLTYLQGQPKNNINAVPADWMVYEDIVKKVLQHVQSKIFAVEVWNEPDLGFDIDNSPYKDKVTAYLDLYYHTATSIRSVNKTILIGGPAAGNTYDTTFFTAMLGDKRIKPYFNFYSYHYYGLQKAGNITSLKKLAALRGRLGFPIVISEWNYSAAFDHNPMNTDDVKTISFVGNTLVDQFKETPYMSLLYCMDEYKHSESFYTMDKDAVLSPKVAVYKLLSVQMGLGMGSSKIYDVKASDELNALSTVNVAGNLGLTIVNSGGADKLTTVNFINTSLSGKKKIKIFEASKDHNADRPIAVLILDFVHGNAAISKLALPANSVVGVCIAGS